MPCDSSASIAWRATSPTPSTELRYPATLTPSGGGGSPRWPARRRRVDVRRAAHLQQRVVDRDLDTAEHVRPAEIAVGVRARRGRGRRAGDRAGARAAPRGSGSRRCGRRRPPARSPRSRNAASPSGVNRSPRRPRRAGRGRAAGRRCRAGRRSACATYVYGQAPPRHAPSADQRLRVARTEPREVGMLREQDPVLVLGEQVRLARRRSRRSGTGTAARRRRPTSGRRARVTARLGRFQYATLKPGSRSR